MKEQETGHSGEDHSGPYELREPLPAEFRES